MSCIYTTRLLSVSMFLILLSLIPTFIHFREEHGDCLPNTKVKGSLGEWVGYVRRSRKHNAKWLNPVRIQLLDDVGFQWYGNPDGWKRIQSGGELIKDLLLH